MKKFLLLFIAVAIFPEWIKAQFGSENILTECDLCGPTNVQNADFDGDGYLDIVSASLINGKIAWYRNDGTGAFTEQIIRSKSASTFYNDSITAPFYVIAADMDNDEDMDILVAFVGGTNNDIVWYKNNGAGIFTEDVRIPVLEGPGAIKIFATDLNGDGYLDILAALTELDRDNYKLAWFENFEGDAFSNPNIISTQVPGLESVFAADIDGDGDMDALSASSVLDDYRVAWYENDGMGNFSFQRIIGNPQYGADLVFAADLDGDGDMDVISEGSFGREIIWYENDGTGMFSDQILISSIQEDYLNNLYFTDLDTDGDIDVLSASEGVLSEIAWYENDGTGVFSDQIIISNKAIGAQSVQAADLDNDGDIDILSSSYILEDKIAWYDNDGTEKFTEQPLTDSPANGLRAIHAADLDKDDHADILFVSQGKIAWFKNEGGAEFSNAEIISTSTVSIREIYTYDLDYDGDLDIATDGLDEEGYIWYQNEGAGNFTRKSVPSSLIFSSFAKISDIDGDGILDIVLANFSQIIWYKNDGAGAFTEQNAVFSQFSSLQGFDIADLDGDADLDVLSIARSPVSGAGYEIVWHKNDGAGNFSDVTFFIVDDGLDDTDLIYVADIDTDGDNDIVWGDSDEASLVTWYENDGAGQFSEPITISAITDFYIEDLYFTDLDSDGDLDILSASTFYLSLYENNGAGEFSEQVIITENAAIVINALTADLDNDGDLDIISGSVYDDKIAWYENLAPVTSTENFTEEPLVKVYPNPFNDFLVLETLNNSGATVMVYDAAGKKIIEKPINGLTVISSEAIPSGIYFYKVISADNIELANGKLLKAK